MPIGGDAFLALWNDHSDEHQDYDFWHTREHVGERLGVPGIRAARRYVAGDGRLPRYFTLYELDGLAVLQSGPYRRLLDFPTPWSRRMRPGMRNFVRRGCRVVTSLGAGIGGAIAVSLLRLSADASRLSLALEGAAPRPPFTAAHLGLVDETVPEAPFHEGGAEPTTGQAHGAGPTAVLILEGYEVETLEPAVRQVAGDLHESRVCATEPSFGLYRLAFALDQEERTHMLPWDRPRS